MTDDERAKPRTATTHLANRLAEVDRMLTNIDENDAWPADHKMDNQANRERLTAERDSLTAALSLLEAAK